MNLKSIIKDLKLKGVFVISFLVICQFTKGQDIHFSQYNASPLNLNPALTGFFYGDYRATLNFRSQWGSISEAYRTVSASFEMSTLKGKLKDDYLSFGLLFYNDKAGAIELATNSIAIAFAYKKAMGFKVKHAITVGFQGGIMKQSLNADNLIFDSQYNGVVGNPAAPSGENIDNGNFGGDLSAGLLWHIVPNRNFNIYFGGAYYHILQPKISFLNNSDYKLGAKYVSHVGSKIRLNSFINLLPSAVGYYQSGAWQVNGGTYLQFVLNDDLDSETSFAIGTWARVTQPAVDALIIGARMDYLKFVIGLSYDVNLSDLKTVSKSRGAYELSLIYIGDLVTRGKRNLTIPCPQL